ncbi:hypothetical protein AK812_SmicGene33145 [Symbiodinium microadriaticum]|uniref:SAP domain-containing protein n=1 Tax=Symbiodinium microadriaticum TaxID=2951 RepID=A0A1Q9CSC2_SYMMI|nr:hypothetical protein AK812_SmicGene33145 [Symbiodinium microadriaticum]
MPKCRRSLSSSASTAFEEGAGLYASCAGAVSFPRLYRRALHIAISDAMLASIMGEEYLEWTVPQLKEHLRALGVASTGSRDFLIQRVQMFSSPSKAKTAKVDAPPKAAASSTPSSKASKAKPATAVKPKVIKAPKAKKVIADAGKKKLARSKRTEDVGDLHSSVASLNGCLKKVPTVDVSKVPRMKKRVLMMSVTSHPETLA